MRLLRIGTVAVAAGLAFVAAPATAAVITGTYAVTGSNFVSSSATVTPPFKSIYESFTITFDTTDTAVETTNISLNSSSTITPASTLGYQYAGGLLFVGGIASSVGASSPTSIDFAVTLRGATDPSSFGVVSLSYSTGQNAIFSAATFGPAAATAVPEPTSLALLGGIVAAGLYRRRSKP